MVIRPYEGGRGGRERDLSGLLLVHTKRWSPNGSMKSVPRRAGRWFAYDYSQAGAYFVTICAADRQGPFGRIEGARMRLNRMGQVADECWRGIPGHFEDVELDTFVVMPNHVHGIIVIGDMGATGATGAMHASPLPPGQGARATGPAARSLGAIVGSYKAVVSKRINEIRATPGRSVWQRNYHEHVIRNGQQLNRIRRYIEANPANWMLDYENPQAKCYGQEERQRSYSY
jgi:REP-associated tyrosine transposase